MYLFYYISLFEVVLTLFLPGCHSHQIHMDTHESNETNQRIFHQMPILDIKLQLLSNKVLLAEHHHSVTDQVLSANDFMEVINILLDRFNCSERLNTEHMSCAKCQSIIANRVFQVLQIEGNSTFDKELFRAAAPILLLTFSHQDMEYSCKDSIPTLSTSDAYLSALVNYGGTSDRLSETAMTSFLAQIDEMYVPATFAKCLDAEQIFDDFVEDHSTGATLKEMQRITTLLVAKFVSGYCIGRALYPNPEEFIHFIFDAYGEHELISLEGFLHLLMDLGIHSQDHHDHVGHDENEIPHHHHATHKRSNRIDGLPSYERQKRHSAMDSDNVPSVYKCLSAEEILLSHGTENYGGITHEIFHEICPALIQQQLGDYCSQHEVHSVPVDYKAYLYGTVFVLLVTLSAALGVLVFPWVKGHKKDLLLNSLVALAVSTLVSEALLHLIPSAFGLHSHEGVVHTHSGHAHEDEGFVWKAVVILVALYLFYVMEVFTVYLRIDETNSPGKRPHHPLEEIKDVKDTSCAIEAYENAEKSTVDEEKRNVRTKYPCLRYGSVPVMIILSGCLHNFADGLAIGASFSISLGRGFSTGLAIVFHELSHEIGDLAILLKSGMQMRWAIFFNLLSGATSFLGLYIGLLIGTSEEAQQWILCITAGMFLYIGLVDMLPTIMDITSFRQPKLTLVLQNIGFIVGAAIIIVISLLEHHINITL